MTDYDIELTMEANTRILMTRLMPAPWDPWKEQEILNFMYAAYQDGYDQARSHWLAGNEIPEVDV